MLSNCCKYKWCATEHVQGLSCLALTHALILMEVIAISCNMLCALLICLTCMASALGQT